jgi:hypothetical protein
MADSKARRQLAYRLAFETKTDWRTAAKWIDGEGIHPTLADAFERVAEANGLMAEVDRLRAAAA